MFEKHLWKSDVLSKDAGHWPGFYISGTLVENGLSLETFHECLTILWTLGVIGLEYQT